MEIKKHDDEENRDKELQYVENEMNVSCFGGE